MTKNTNIVMRAQLRPADILKMRNAINPNVKIKTKFTAVAGPEALSAAKSASTLTKPTAKVAQNNFTASETASGFCTREGESTKVPLGHGHASH